MRRRHVWAVGACAAFSLCAMPATAPASVTLGQTCSPNATSQITAIQTATAAGVPAASAPFAGVITSFSVLRHPTEAFQARLKVFHRDDAMNFTAVANGPLAMLAPGLNVIAARVPIAAGDFIGTWGDPGTQRCNFVPLENVMESYFGPEPQPPQSFMTNTFNGVIVDLSAQLEHDVDGDGFGDETQDRCPAAPGPNDGCPSNTFSFGKLKRNKHKGTATLTVVVPGPGMLVLTGKGLVKQRPGGAPGTARVAAKIASAAGKVKLKVRPKAKKKRKLNRTGKVRVKAKVTYTPTGGKPNTETKRIKLIKRL